MRVKPLLWIGVLAIAGCVGQPSSPPPTPTNYVGATGQSLSTVSQADLDEKRLTDAKKRGYTLVDNDGETLYCRSDLKTGSHVQKNTTCLTGQELDALHNQTGQGLQSIRPLPPPVGK
jgi:hypothetical protein